MAEEKEKGYMKFDVVPPFLNKRILNCPKCGGKLVPVYPAKTVEELLRCEKPDFWFCDHDHLEYKETKTGKLGKGIPRHWPKRPG